MLSLGRGARPARATATSARRSADAACWVGATFADCTASRRPSAGSVASAATAEAASLLDSAASALVEALLGSAGSRRSRAPARPRPRPQPRRSWIRRRRARSAGSPRRTASWRAVGSGSLPVRPASHALAVAEVAASEQQARVLAAVPSTRSRARRSGCAAAHPVDVGVEERHEIGEPRVERGRDRGSRSTAACRSAWVHPLGVDVLELKRLEALALLDRVPQLERDVRRGERVGREHEEKRVGALDRLV